jgi:hypothetical protein
MRAELREWFYDDERKAWEGQVYGDLEEVFDNGQPMRFSPQAVKEVIEYLKYDVLVTKGNERYFMMHSTRLNKPG